MEEGLVEFNICGTRYQSRRSVIEAQPHSMLAMLLRHPTNNESLRDSSIFIQRDPLIFRWILYWYSTGILVSEQTVGVPKEVWDHELDYYAIFPGKEEQKVEETKKRIRDESHELANKAVEHLVKLDQEIDKAREERRGVYKNLLAYMMDNQVLEERATTGFDFIAAEDSQRTFFYPSSFDVRARVNPSWLNKWFDEFEQYCADVGFSAKKGSYSNQTTANHTYYPACDVHIRTGHAHIHVSFKALH